MSLSLTYITLKSAITSFTEDQGSEFAAFLDTIIGLGETRLLKDLDLEQFDLTAAVTITPGSPLVTKPANLVAVRSFHYTDASGNFQFLEEKSWEFIKDYWPKESTTTATPKYYTEYNATQWYLGGTPSASVTAGTVRYIVRPSGLSGSVATTWLSTTVPDALLYACLVSSEQFLKADDRVPQWRQEYTVSLASARNELRRQQRDDYTPMDTVETKE